MLENPVMTGVRKHLRFFNCKSRVIA